MLHLRGQLQVQAHLPVNSLALLAIYLGCREHADALLQASLSSAGCDLRSRQEKHCHIYIWETNVDKLLQHPTCNECPLAGNTKICFFRAQTQISTKSCRLQRDHCFGGNPSHSLLSATALSCCLATCKVSCNSCPYGMLLLSRLSVRTTKTHSQLNSRVRHHV